MEKIMKDKLIKLLDNAYSPYSKYRVAAIVLMKDGKEFYGVNVENASYGATICADSDTISTCCFVCRQVINEFFDKNATVTCFDQKGNFKEFRVSDLCPYPFSEDDLK